MSKQNVTREESVAWNHHVNGSVEDALKTTYDQVQAHSHNLRRWYWSSIRSKKHQSITARVVSYLFGAVGVLAPLAAALLSTAGQRLLLTQTGVVALAVAGLAQLCDKVFGWSSGWQRYVTTVTIMEQRAAQFEFDWAKRLRGLGMPLGLSDARSAFELAEVFTLELEQLRGKETDAWVAEFNAGQAALSEIVALKREPPSSRPALEATATATVTTSEAPGGPAVTPAPAAVAVVTTGGTPQ